MTGESPQAPSADFIEESPADTSSGSQEPLPLISGARFLGGEAEARKWLAKTSKNDESTKQPEQTDTKE